MDVEELSSDEEKENNIEEPSVDPHQKMSLLQESLRNAMMAQRTQLSQVVAEAMKTMYTPLAAQLSEIVRNMAKTIMASYQPDLSGLAEAARHMLVDLGETLKGITFATISEEQKEQLLQAHKQWGEYGWTINPNASVDTLFDSAPSDKKTADQIALKECSNASMKSVFKSISEMKHSKKIDFEEAVFDFDNRKYKSCALMLFALIDAKLIRLQKDSTLNGKGRSVGAKAVEKAKARATEITEDHMLFTLLFEANLFACLEKVFEKGNDFRKQPEVLNRNFLDHGMLTRKATRKDCVQLFLLYYNILELLDMIYQ